jgi:hypothetical protein
MKPKTWLYIGLGAAAITAAVIYSNIQKADQTATDDNSTGTYVAGAAGLGALALLFLL